MSLFVKHHDPTIIEVECHPRPLIGNYLAPESPILPDSLHNKDRTISHLIIYISQTTAIITLEGQPDQFLRISEFSFLASCLQILSETITLNDVRLQPVSDTEIKQA